MKTIYFDLDGVLADYVGSILLDPHPVTGPNGLRHPGEDNRYED